MSGEVDYYELLGLDTAASTDAVRNAYKEKAMKHHPDRGGSAALWAQIQKAYDTLSDIQRRAVYDRTKTDAESGAERQFTQKFGEGTFDLSERGPARGRKGGMNILKQMEEVRKDEERISAANRTAVIQSGFSMSHSAGFEAWMRNQKGIGNHGFFTAEDLLRESKAGNLSGVIEATGSSATPLPTLTATALRFDRHGPPEEVLKIDPAFRLPDTLGHGEVLVYWLASSVTEEDLLRIQTPLTILNNFPPFNRTKHKWEEIRLPATAGGEGVGIILATAKDVPLARIDETDEAAKAMRSLPGMHAHEHSLEVKDWVVALPDSRRAPVGCWSTLSVCASDRLLKVPAQLLPLQHYACSRSLCTAYRLLEDYGSLRPGDTIIQNAADLPVGQAAIQLCKMLKIRTINLVPDDAGFERSKVRGEGMEGRDPGCGGRGHPCLRRLRALTGARRTGASFRCSRARAGAVAWESSVGVGSRGSICRCRGSTYRYGPSEASPPSLLSSWRPDFGGVQTSRRAGGFDTQAREGATHASLLPPDPPTHP